jgi:tetratricopeptide (TPR) repeat protein
MCLGRHDDAIASHQRYQQLAPNEANAYDSLGLSYQWAGRYGEAIEQYKRALAIDPEFEVARIHLANLHFQQGRYREAIQECQRYIRDAPSNLERARGYASIAQIYLSRGEADLARKAATTLRFPFYFRGYVNLKEGRVAEAIENFKESLRHYPAYWATDSYEDCLANAYFESNLLDEAIAEYNRILRLNPNYPLAHYHLAQAFERKGEYEQARVNYNRFLQVWAEADPDIRYVIDAKRRLSGLSVSN